MVEMTANDDTIRQIVMIVLDVAQENGIKALRHVHRNGLGRLALLDRQPEAELPAQFEANVLRRIRTAEADSQSVVESRGWLWPLSWCGSAHRRGISQEESRCRKRLLLSFCWWRLCSC